MSPVALAVGSIFVADLGAATVGLCSGPVCMNVRACKCMRELDAIDPVLCM